MHAQYVDGSLRLYLGESKLHKSFSNAASSAVKSISNCLQKYSDEFDLIDSYIDFPEMDAKTRDELIDLLDPFSASNGDLSEILHAPCFIGFVEPAVFSDDESEYKRQYVDVAKNHIGDFYDKLRDKERDIDKTALLLLPFSSIDELVEEFIKYMGIEA